MKEHQVNCFGEWECSSVAKNNVTCSNSSKGNKTCGHCNKQVIDENGNPVPWSVKQELVKRMENPYVVPEKVRVRFEKFYS